MTLPRFYHPGSTDATASTIVLGADEAHHLTHVLRLRAGDAVLLFDGRGTQYRGTVATAGRTGATIDRHEPVPAAAELPITITLCQALLKAEGMDEVVRDATMLGVAVIQPVVAARSVLPAQASRQATVLERWRRVALASVKQCGRAVLPRIEHPRSLAEILGERVGGPAFILLEPGVADASTGAGALPRDGVVRVLSGPEGGWTPEEAQAARAAGWRALSLGPSTLRADAAPVAALAVLSWWAARPGG